MDVQLIVSKGGARAKRFQLSRETTIIGRRRDCNLCIPSSEVSRRHCLLQVQDGYLTIEDLNSINGTFLNDQRIGDKSVVYPGDRLAVGPVHFTVKYELSAEARAKLQQSSPAGGEEFLEAVPVEEELPTIKVEDGTAAAQEFEIIEDVGDSQVVEIIDDPEVVELVEDAEVVDEVEDAEVVEIIEDAEIVEEVPPPKRKQKA